MTNALAVAAQRLADLLTQENAALRALDLPRAAGMLADKQRALAELTVAQAQPGQPLDQATLCRLRELAEQNRCLLDRAITIQGRVIGVIASAIPRAATTPRYGLQGRLANSGRPAAFALAARA